MFAPFAVAIEAEVEALKRARKPLPKGLVTGPTFTLPLYNDPDGLVTSPPCIFPTIFPTKQYHPYSDRL